MKTIHTIQALRQQLRNERDQGRRIALVPTMGNLHEGHLALVRRATELGETVVTSIFVNPMQFGPDEDLDQYPRTLPEDQEKLAANGNHIVFAPSVSEVYPNGQGNQTSVSVPGVSDDHCGASRPGHFDGVSTVVTMLFNMVQPDVAVFGEKDFQQLAVIRKLTQDLFLPVNVVGVATTRESDGLAMSSRNGYLSDADRSAAPALYQTLQQTAQALGDGSKNFAALEKAAGEALTQSGFRPDYVHIVNSVNLEPATPDDRQLTILAAAFLGDTRLIDNVSVSR